MKKATQYLFKLVRRIRYRIHYYFLKLLLKELGENVRVYGFPYLGEPGRISIGANTTINPGVILNGRGGITIGKDVRLSSRCIIETGGLTIHEIPRIHQAKPIVIEDGAWVATGAIVLSGVTIGKNAIVAAGAIVTKSVPPNSLAIGIPAQIRPLEIALHSIDGYS